MSRLRCKEEVVAFAQVGAYEVLVADNLESELDGTESVMTYANATPNEFSAKGTCNPLRGAATDDNVDEVL